MHIHIVIIFDLNFEPVDVKDEPFRLRRLLGVKLSDDLIKRFIKDPGGRKPVFRCVFKHLAVTCLLPGLCIAHTDQKKTFGLIFDHVRILLGNVFENKCPFRMIRQHLSITLFFIQHPVSVFKTPGFVPVQGLTSRQNDLPVIKTGGLHGAVQFV